MPVFVWILTARLRDAPFYQKLSEGEISILVPNDQLRLYRQIQWKRLFTRYESALYDIPFPPAAPAGVSDFAVTGVALLSYTAGGSGAGTPTVAASDITVSIPGESVNGTARFAIGNGIQALFGADPAIGHQGQTLPVTITGAFTHFAGSTTLVFSNPGVTAAKVVVADETHLSANLTITPSAAAGAVNVTALTGNELAVGPGIFTVSDAPMITAVNPARGTPGTVDVTVTGMATHFEAGVTKLSLSNTNVTAVVLSVADTTHLTARLTISASVKGTLSLKAVTNRETATSRPLFVAGTPTPEIVSVTAAAAQPGQSLPLVTIVGRDTHFAAGSTVTFTNPNVKASKVQRVDDTHLTAALDISADAVSAPATASTAGKPTNTYAVTGSRLKDVKILVPSNVALDVNTDTLVTFSLTDDQAKAFKSVVVQHGTDMPVVAALPAAPGGAAAAAPKPSIKPASAVPPGTSSITLTGTGMSQVVSVRYLDTSLPFTTKGDTSLTIGQLPALTPPAIELVFVYADKTLAPYAIPVQAQGPR